MRAQRIFLSIRHALTTSNFLLRRFCRKTIWWLTILLTGVAGYGANADDDQFSVLRSPKPLPEFSLVDQHGSKFSRQDLQNQWSLVFVGFTSCPHVCPMTLRRLEALRAEMGFRIGVDKIPEIVFLAVDPARDQPVLKDYLANFDPSNIGITGDKSQIDTLVSGLDAGYRFADIKPGSDYYDVLHSSAINLINPRGEMVARLNPPFAVQPMTEFLVNLIRSKTMSISTGETPKIVGEMPKVVIAVDDD